MAKSDFEKILNFVLYPKIVAKKMLLVLNYVKEKQVFVKDVINGIPGVNPQQIFECLTIARNWRLIDVDLNKPETKMTLLESGKAFIVFLTNKLGTEEIRVSKKKKERKEMKKIFLIIRCTCGKYLISQKNWKTRQCPYCSNKIIMNSADVIFKTSDLKKASTRLQKLKSQAGASPISKTPLTRL